MNFYITTRKADYVEYAEALAVDVETDCGDEAQKSVAYIIEPDSETVKQIDTGGWL